MQAVVQRNSSPPASILRLQIGLGFLAFVLIGANDGALGVLLPSLRGHYGLDKATVSLLFLAGTAGYLCAAFTSGLLTERLGTRLFLGLGAAAFLAGAGAFALMLPFGVLLAAMLIFGFGIAAIDAGLNSHIARLPVNTALLNYLHAFYGVGALLGPLLATLVLSLEWGWNSVYVVWLGLSLLLLIGFTLLFNGRETLAFTEEAGTGNKNLLLTVIKLRAVWLAALFLLFYVGAEVSLGSWSYSLLTEERHETAVFSGWVVSGYWMGLTLGRFLLGRVAQRIGNRRMIEACLAGVIAGVLLAWVGSGIIAAAGLFLTGFCLGPIFPTTIALMSQLAPSRLLPTIVGLLASAGSIGAAIFTWQAGSLAQAVGLWSLLPFVIVITAAMLASWIALVSNGNDRRGAVTMDDRR